MSSLALSQSILHLLPGSSTQPLQLIEDAFANIRCQPMAFLISRVKDKEEREQRRSWVWCTSLLLPAYLVFSFGGCRWPDLFPANKSSHSQCTYGQCIHFITEWVRGTRKSKHADITELDATQRWTQDMTNDRGQCGFIGAVPFATNWHGLRNWSGDDDVHQIRDESDGDSAKK